jgi:hypothetical protein
VKNCSSESAASTASAECNGYNSTHLVNVSNTTSICLQLFGSPEEDGSSPIESTHIRSIGTMALDSPLSVARSFFKVKFITESDVTVDSSLILKSNNCPNGWLLIVRFKVSKIPKLEINIGPIIDNTHI